MPRYDFLNTETGEITEYSMSWKDLDKFKEDNPHLKQQINTPQIVGGHGDRVKTDDGFKEVLSKTLVPKNFSKFLSWEGVKSLLKMTR